MREKITDLDKKKVNSDDSLHRYKGNTADLKLDKLDNALNIINRIQNGEISLADVKNNQEKSWRKKQGNKSIDQKSQKHFVQH